MTPVPISQATLQRLSRAMAMNGPLCVLVAGGLFSTRSAIACVVEEGSFNPPTFVVAFIFSLLVVSVLTFLAWVIRRLFFKHTILFSALFLATSLLSIFLGILGTFVIPEFESVYASFGANLPSHTKALISARQLLWLPALIVLVLWYASRSSSKKTRYFAATLFVEANLLLLALWALYAPIFKMGDVACR